MEGFLYGTQPEPLISKDGMVDFQSEEYKNWEKDVELFRKTGFWTEEIRKCGKCNIQLQPSEPMEICRDCQ